MSNPLTPVQPEKYVANERLWLTANGEKLVKDGDPEAAVLFTTPGKFVSKEDAVKFGLVKKAEAPSNKAKDAPGNKAAAGENGN